MSRFKVMSAVLRGSEAVPVQLEAELQHGMLPGLDVVGASDADAIELRALVRTALRACGYDVPRTRMTVCVSTMGRSPHSVRSLALPVAAAVLGASGQIPPAAVEGRLLAGGLAIDGSVLPPRGGAAIQLLARDSGTTLLTSSSETACVPGMLGIDSLAAIADPAAPRPIGRAEPERTAGPDMADMPCSDLAKRAAAVSAAGGHGLLVLSADSHLAREFAERIPSIMPDPTEAEVERMLKAHSACGEDIATILDGNRPFRCVDPCMSTARIIGGGRPVRPGEVSLADGGVLFLDGLASFNPLAKQSLNSVMEQRAANIVRVDGLYEMPADFTLVAADSPCPCGGFGTGGCACSPREILRWREDLADRLGPRLELAVELADTGIADRTPSITSAQLKEQVERAVAFRAWRDAHGIGSGPGATARETLEGIERLLGITNRGARRVAGISRTIADMAESPEIAEEHLIEAAALRNALGPQPHARATGLDALELDCAERGGPAAWRQSRGGDAR